MKVPLKTKPSASSRVLSIVLVLACGFLLGRFASGPSAAQADVRETPRREAFQSGDELSLGVLKEISATLKRMDARLERMERAVPKVNAASPADDSTRQ